MNAKRKTIIRVFGAVAASIVVIYVGAYIVQSRLGMIDSIEIGRGSKPRIWTFDGCRQDVHVYTEGECRDAGRVRTERALLTFYLPLVRLDRLLGNYHLLDEDLPEMGG